MAKLILRMALLAVVGFILLLFLWSDLRSSVSQTITRLIVSSEDVSVPVDPGGDAKDEEMDLEIVTLLGFDAIPAILDPQFVSVDEADDWMELRRACARTLDQRRQSRLLRTHAQLSRDSQRHGRRPEDRRHLVTALLLGYRV